MMKVMKTFLCVLMVSTAAVESQINFNAHSTVIDGNNFVSTGTNSVVQSNGNSVVISRRMGPNNEEQQYISVSSPNVRIDGDYFTCSGLVCKKEAFKCVVTSEAIATDIANMRTVAECMDKSGKVLDQKTFTEKNPFPRAQPPYSRYGSVDRDGAVHTEDSNGQNEINSRKLTKEEQEAVQKNVNEQTRRINLHIEQQQQQLEKQMQDMQKRMSETFWKWLPFQQRIPFRQRVSF